MSETKLLNCPFCGGEAVTAEMYNTKLKKLFPIVKCLDCECRTPMTETFEEAIAVWNTRKPMERIMERLKEEPYINKGGELFLNGYNEDCLPLRKVFEIVKEEGGIE